MSDEPAKRIGSARRQLIAKVRKAVASVEQGRTAALAIQDIADALRMFDAGKENRNA